MRGRLQDVLPSLPFYLARPLTAPAPRSEEDAITPLGLVLLRHRRIVVPELFAEPSPETTGSGDGGSRGTDISALEADLLVRGVLMSAPLRRWLADLDPAARAKAGVALRDALDAELGWDATHMPQFRRFPDSVPADTEELYVRRVFSLLLQKPAQPCVLCARIGTVHPVSPCAHLVCRRCWDGSDYSGCPICHRRIDPADPFLRPAGEPPQEPGTDDAVITGRARLLVPGDAGEAARDLLTAMLARRTPPSAGDLADLDVLAAHVGPDGLPDAIPVREARAVVLARLARDASPETVADLLRRHADTATDVLRTLSVLMGGDAGLRERPQRHANLPRALRRVVIAHLDGLAFAALAEDMARHPQRWKRMAEVLHPFERHRHHPAAALAFALVRGTRVDAGTPLGRTLLDAAARHPGTVRVDGDRLRLITHGSHVEAALRDGELDTALRLLAGRPGDLARRLVHLLRTADAQDRSQDVCAALERAAPRVSPGVLAAALTRLRTPPGGTRLFLPRGGLSRVWYEPDRSPPPAAVRDPAAGVIVGELLRRAGRLPRVRHAVLDETLAHLAVPVAERSTSAALLRIPRGSVQPLPDDERIRLFLHWVEPDDETVDLDLSVVFYDERWQFIGLCDYTDLRFGVNAAVHSGDLTSAPAPQGASEFVDLRPERLLESGVRHAAVVVFSYNDIPFEKLRRGFAGMMRDPGGRLFDPAAVTQRFDLTGPAKILLPFTVDLEARTLRWADFNLPAGDGGHNAYGYQTALARLGKTVEQVFGAPGRPSLWDVARWHAAARADEVTVRRQDGALLRYRRRTGEDVAAFAARLDSPGARDTVPDEPGAGSAGFAALVHGDLEPAPGAEVFALYPWRLDASRVRLLDAAALMGALAPERAEAVAVSPT